MALPSPSLTVATRPCICWSISRSQSPPLVPVTSSVNDQAMRKAAVFLMALGPQVGGKVMSKLPESMVEELAHKIRAWSKLSAGIFRPASSVVMAAASCPISDSTSLVIAPSGPGSPPATARWAERRLSNPIPCWSAI